MADRLVADPEADVLRLDAEAIAVIAALADADYRQRLDREELVARLLPALERHGLVADGEVVPGIDRIGRAVAGSVLDLGLSVEMSARSYFAPGWATREAIVLALPTADDEELFDVVAVPPPHLPATLATLLDVGPRPPHSVASPIVWSEVADAFLHPGEPLSGEARPDELDEEDLRRLRRIHRALRTRWSLTATWGTDDEEPLSTALEAVDAGDLGWWLLLPLSDGEDAEPGLVPVSPTVVWMALTAFLPVPEEVDVE